MVESSKNKEYYDRTFCEKACTNIPDEAAEVGEK
jgi:hypothetical protein